MQSPTVDEKEVDEGVTKGHDRFVVALQPVYKFRDASVVSNGSLSLSLSLSLRKRCGALVMMHSLVSSLLLLSTMK
jgi:hypothetical protein